MAHGGLRAKKHILRVIVLMKLHIALYADRNLSPHHWHRQESILASLVYSVYHTHQNILKRHSTKNRDSKRSSTNRLICVPTCAPHVVFVIYLISVCVIRRAANTTCFIFGVNVIGRDDPADISGRNDRRIDVLVILCFWWWGER